MNKDVELINFFLHSVIDKRMDFSIETLKIAFSYMLEKYNSDQEPEISDMWIDYTWDIIQKIPKDTLYNAYGDNNFMHNLLYGYFGK